MDVDHPKYGALNEHVIDLVIIAFFWLLRPAEYCGDNLVDPDNALSVSFLFCHTQVTIGGTVYPGPTAPLHDANQISLITHGHLTFSNQKNAVKGEVISHAATSDKFFCGAKALGRILHRYQKYGAAPKTPICKHYNPYDKRWYDIKAKHVTNSLQYAAQTVQPITGITHKLLSARSLRPGGATALMLANVDSDHICLMGRWKSDAMFRCLRIQAAAHQKAYAQRMLDHGTCTFTPALYDQGSASPNDTPEALRNVLEATSSADDSDSD